MQERVTPTGSDFAELVVQFNKDHDVVGLGLEPNTSVPQAHFIDALYGDVPTQTEIGRILHSRMNEFGWDMIEFQDSDTEAEFLNRLGRAVLDAVTGSSANDGMWTWLNRSGVNRLIRLLRKARDMAFGRDE